MSGDQLIITNKGSIGKYQFGKNMDIGFKVPKLVSKEKLQKLSLKGNDFLTNVHPKLSDSYVKPQQSGKQFSFVNAWSINNKEAEQIYISRRQSMRKQNQNLAESFGFIYLKSKQSLGELTSVGHIHIGNVKDSFLGTGSSGVSLCQHADVYHPGELHGVPKTGYLIIVKYLKGRINFVKYDKSPMEPQPSFDCHMLKNVNIMDKNISAKDAFNMSQVFIYEYSEDGDIQNYPSQLLPIYAIEFQWYGTYIFRLVIPQLSKNKLTEKNNQRHLNMEVENHFVKNNTHRISRRLSDDTSIHKKDSTFSSPCTLVFFRTNSNLPNLKIISTVYMYMKNPVVFPQLYNSQWEISDLIEISEFEKQLKLFQFHLQDKINQSKTDLLDPLSHDLFISNTCTNLLTLSENNLKEPFLLSNDTSIPKFVTYLRIVPDSDKESKQFAFKLIDHFNNSKSIARVSFGSTDDQYKTLLFIFPDGKFSKKLGLPSITTDSYYFHGLLLHFQHPEFSLCNNLDLFEEKSIYFNGLSSSRKQAVKLKLKSTKSIFDSNVLKRTCLDQAKIQRDMYSMILKPNINSQPLRYSNLCCDNLPEISIESSSQTDSSCNMDIDEQCVPSVESHNSPNQSNQSSTKNHSKTSTNTESNKLKQLKKSEIKDILYTIYKNPTDDISVPQEIMQSDLGEGTSNSHSQETMQLDLGEGTSNSHSQETIQSDLGEDTSNSHSQETMQLDLGEGTSNSQTNFQLDLLPMRRKFLHNASDNGYFRELVFVNECYASVSDSNKLICFDKTNSSHYSKPPNRYKKMWSFDRSIFRRIKDMPGVSYYDG